MSKTAIITGVNGQDGAFLAQFLLKKGYKVFGGLRRSSQKNLNNLERLGIKDNIKYFDFELLEQSNISENIKKYQPDEFYNLAAQSFVASSFVNPVFTTQVDAIGVLHILEAIKQYSQHTKFYQASTSEMFGKVQETPQTETTSFYPRSPYGVAKLFAHNTVVNYRESYNLFACSGILFNHESELRGIEFVTRKITDNVAKRYLKRKEVLKLGNIEAKRDWGYSKEYVEGMYLMLQQDKADDYILATGETTTIRQFVEFAFKEIDVEIDWQGQNENEKGFDKKNGELLIEIEKQFYRPAEVDLLLGDPKKAKEILGWEAKTKVKELAKLMVQADINYYLKTKLYV